MKVTISKRFDFDAAHHLIHVAEDHKCRRVHGHTYKVKVVCRGEVDARGMVIDYAQIAAAWAKVHDVIDHHDLNEIPGLENPTTEVLAPWIFDKLVEASEDLAAVLYRVRVYESSTTWCEVTATDYLAWVHERRA